MVRREALELWDAITGKATPLGYRIEGGETVVLLELGPADTRFVVFREATAALARTGPAVAGDFPGGSRCTCGHEDGPAEAVERECRSGDQIFLRHCDLCHEIRIARILKAGVRLWLNLGAIKCFTLAIYNCEKARRSFSIYGLLAFIHSQGRIHVDETRMPVIDPGRGKVRLDQFWAHGTDDRGWNGPAPPAVCYVYDRSRSHRTISEQLGRYHGVLQVDGYSAYKKLEDPGRKSGTIVLAFCLAHLRRRFVDLHKKTQSPITAQIIKLIGQVYRIEAEIRGTSAGHRFAMRQAKSKAIMAELKVLLDDTLARVSTKADLATDIRYAQGHWHGLTRFLDDGRIEVDNNMIARQMRPIGLQRKNSLFAGSESGAESWAKISSLLQTAKMNGLDPFTWLDDVLNRIVSGDVKNNELDQLLAWNWKPALREEQLDIAARTGRSLALLCLP